MMEIIVKAKTKARETLVKRLDDTHYVVSVPETPVKGEANDAIVHALADYFGVRPYQVKIKKGLSSKQKLVEIG